jgi:hypothetical protein
MQTPNKPHHTSLHHTEVAVWCTVSFRVIVVMFCKEYNDVTIVVTGLLCPHGFNNTATFCTARNPFNATNMLLPDYVVSWNG